VSTLTTLLVLGVATGVAWGLFALGYALVYDVLGMLNLAHGDILMLATFVCLGTYDAVGSAVLAVAAGLAVGGIAGALVEQVAYRPLRYGADAVAPLVSALGAALVLRNLAQASFGPADRRFPDLLPGGSLHLAEGGVPVASLVALVLALVAAVVARRALTGTRPGAIVSAVAQDVVAARLVGLPVWIAVASVYAFAGVVAAIGGVLYASTFGIIKLSIGWNATVVAFTAAIIGGRGSLVGAVLGGVGLGVVTTLLTYVVPSGYREAVTFILLAALIVAAPARSTRESLSTVSPT